MWRKFLEIEDCKKTFQGRVRIHYKPTKHETRGWRSALAPTCLYQTDLIPSQSKPKPLKIDYELIAHSKYNDIKACSPIKQHTSLVRGNNIKAQVSKLPDWNLLSNPYNSFISISFSLLILRELEMRMLLAKIFLEFFRYWKTIKSLGKTVDTGYTHHGASAKNRWVTCDIQFNVDEDSKITSPGVHLELNPCIFLNWECFYRV